MYAAWATWPACPHSQCQQCRRAAVERFFFLHFLSSVKGVSRRKGESFEHTSLDSLSRNYFRMIKLLRHFDYSINLVILRGPIDHKININIEIAPGDAAISLKKGADHHSKSIYYHHGHYAMNRTILISSSLFSR